MHRAVGKSVIHIPQTFPVRSHFKQAGGSSEPTALIISGNGIHVIDHLCVVFPLQGYITQIVAIHFKKAETSVARQNMPVIFVMQSEEIV